MNEHHSHANDDLGNWADIPTWQEIAVDWHARMESAGAPTAVLDLPVIAADARGFYSIERNTGTWLPVSTLTNMKVASWDNQHTLLRGEPYAYRNPATDFPYVSAGASDAAHIMAKFPDPTTFAAVMIAMTSLAVGWRSYQPAGAIDLIGQLAFAHLRPLGTDRRMIAGMNRKSWLPAHYLEHDFETYDDAIAHLVGEHIAVLEEYRPVRFVPFAKRAGGFEPLEFSDIKQAADDRDHEISTAMQARYELDTDRPSRVKKDDDARNPYFSKPGDEERYNVALDFFNRTVAATGRDPDRYARAPFKIEIGAKPKPKAKKLISVNLFRGSDVCDEPDYFPLLEFNIGFDGSDPEGAAEQIQAYVDQYEDVLERHRQIRASGRDPTKVQPGEVTISALAARLLELGRIEVGKTLNFTREEHLHWKLFPRLDFDHHDHVEFSIKDAALYVKEIDVPCPIFGCLTVRMLEDGPIIVLVPRPIALPKAGVPIQEALSSPVFQGLPPIKIVGSECYSDRTMIEAVEAIR